MGVEPSIGASGTPEKENNSYVPQWKLLSTSISEASHSTTLSWGIRQ